jgi:hypothetical protein
MTENHPLEHDNRSIDMTENHQKDDIVTHLDVIQFAAFIFYQSSNLRMKIQSESAMEKLHKRWMDEN